MARQNVRYPAPRIQYMEISACMLFVNTKIAMKNIFLVVYRKNASRFQIYRTFFCVLMSAKNFAR